MNDVAMILREIPSGDKSVTLRGEHCRQYGVVRWGRALPLSQFQVVNQRQEQAHDVSVGGCGTVIPGIDSGDPRLRSPSGPLLIAGVR